MPRSHVQEAKKVFRIGMILAVGALAACGRERAPENAPTPVRVQTVQLYSDTSVVRYSAEVEPRESVSLAFKVGGYVEEILQRRGVEGRLRPVQGGDVVPRGAVLARVREDDYVARLDQAKAALAAAKAAALKARSDLDRASALDKTRSVTQTDLDAARAAFDANEAQEQEAGARLEQAKISLRDCSLASPMDAMVLDRKVERGDLVGPGSVGFILADVTSVKVVFGVPDRVVRDLKTGDSLPVHTESSPSPVLPGRITAISPSADSQSRVFEVEVTLPNPNGDLKPGMIATVEVQNPEKRGEGQETPIPVVPLSAVVRSRSKAGAYALFVIQAEGGKSVARARDVTVGEVYGNLIAIPQGIQPGDSVIVRGAALVSDGEAVRIIP